VHHDDRRHFAVSASRYLKARPEHDRLAVPFNRVGDLVDVEERDVSPGLLRTGGSGSDERDNQQADCQKMTFHLYLHRSGHRVC
jgi:hypothetical protein